MHAFWAMVRANILMSVRNRAALFWNLAFPALFIVIFGAVFSRGVEFHYPVGLIEPLNAYGEQAAAALSANPGFSVFRGDEQSELAGLDDGERAALIRFPEGTGTQPAAELITGETSTLNNTIGLEALQNVLATAAGGDSPVTLTRQTVSVQNIQFMDSFLPGIVAMSLMNSGIIGLSTAFVNYRERGILRRIKLTPFPLTAFILARVVSQVITAVAQALILVLLAVVLFGARPHGNVLLALLAIVVGALAFLAIGFALSATAKNAETAASYANLITFPMLFLSGVFVSMDNAPAWLQPIVRILPLPYLVEALRGVMTFGRGITVVGPDLLVLLFVFAMAMAIAVRFFRWEAGSRA